MPLAVDELAEAGWCPLQGVALRVADLVIGRHADAADELPGGQRKSTWGREVTALVLLVAKVGASRHCETPIWRRRYETRRPALTAAEILFTASRLIALESRRPSRMWSSSRFPRSGLANRSTPHGERPFLDEHGRGPVSRSSRAAVNPAAARHRVTPPWPSQVFGHEEELSSHHLPSLAGGRR